LQIEFEDSLVDVEGPPVRAAAVAAGRLELDEPATQPSRSVASMIKTPVSSMEPLFPPVMRGAEARRRRA